MIIKDLLEQSKDSADQFNDKIDSIKQALATGGTGEAFEMEDGSHLMSFNNNNNHGRSSSHVPDLIDTFTKKHKNDGIDDASSYSGTDQQSSNFRHAHKPSQ